MKNLQKGVTRTKETFNYYHAHIYLIDEQGENLEMAEGYGQAGAEMKRQGHVIPIAVPRSLVARAARESRVIAVENVRDDPDWQRGTRFLLGHRQPAGVLSARFVRTVTLKSAGGDSTGAFFSPPFSVDRHPSNRH